MEARKWENFNSDCLANIFGRLDLESLLLDVPFVCKHWYQALLNPLCWQKLVFPVNISRSRLADHAFEWGGGSVNISLLIKFVVDRSQGSATILVLPKGTTREDLIYVSNVCPSLKSLTSPYTFYDNLGDDVSELIIKWKSLEVLKLGRCINLVQMIDKLSLHCKNLVGFSVVRASIDHEEASAIVSKLGTIKYLALNGANLGKGHLKLILLGCQHLELLYVKNCEGFDEDDEEIIKLASRIKDFKCEGSRKEMYDVNYEDYLAELGYGDYCYNSERTYMSVVLHVC